MATKAQNAKARPILFSGEMVRAILAGKKTRTMRIVKPQPHEGIARFLPLDDCFKPVWNGPTAMSDDEFRQANEVLRCRYGSPLWVRENFRETFDIDERPVLEYRAGGTRLIAEGPRIEHGEHRCTSVLPKWRPSIHMPRWASRITLEITDVAVQRVQEITEEQIESEGVTPGAGIWAGSLRGAFRELWDKINGAGAWERNDWCWAISFKRIEEPR